MRSFIAIELPEEIKTELCKIQYSLKQATQCPVKWVSPESIHLTLCFLSEISPAQGEAVKGIMGSVALKVSPFVLTLKTAGAFPSLERPQTVWVGLQGKLDNLGQLHRELEERLRTTGYKAENRIFRPHLTLGRVRDDATLPARQSLGEAISLVPSPEPKEITVSEISLMKSSLLPSGAVYTRLYAAKLKGLAQR